MRWDKQKINERRAKGRRAYAMERNELRQHETAPRISADSPTAMAVKAEDPEIRKLIDDAIARRASHG